MEPLVKTQGREELVWAWVIIGDRGAAIRGGIGAEGSRGVGEGAELLEGVEDREDDEDRRESMLGGTGLGVGPEPKIEEGNTRR